MPYHTRTRAVWDTLHTSLWFVPSLMAVAGAALTGLSLVLEGTAGSEGPVPWFVYVSPARDARDVVSTLLASMMTMASLVFSITMVVLTLAASQFGPRLIRAFMASPTTQLVLGTFVLTIVHCLLSLSAIGWRQTDAEVPFYTVSLAILLALVSVGMLVLYLHVLARSIISETVVARVGAELDASLDELGKAPGEASRPEAALPVDFDRRAKWVGCGSTGYVQAIDFETLVEVAASADVLVGLSFRGGDFVIADGGGIGIYPGDRASPELVAAVARTVLIGAHRTPVQDPDFAIRHLVEVAVRALSPGINDPYTAVAVINQLSASLAKLLGRHLPEGVMRDRDRRPRVVCPRPSYASLIAASFNQIRQNGGGKPVVVIHLIEALERMAGHVRSGEQRRALLDELDRILETARRAVPDASDRDDIGTRAAAARAVIENRLRAG